MSPSLGEIILSSEIVGALQTGLLGGSVESCAILFAHEVKRSDGLLRFLVRESEFASDDDYVRRGALEAELTPACVARVSKKARLSGTSIIFVHSHPGNHPPEFSRIDDEGEVRLRDFLSIRNANLTHGALIVSAGGFCAREIGTRNYWRIIGLGDARKILFDPRATQSETLEVHDRQVRAFGRQGQKIIDSLRIAIVGLGGTGSIIAEQLVHLGVRDFILVDPDTVEESNLNRVVNAYACSVHEPKVDVAARYITQVASAAKIKKIKADVTSTKVASALLDADFIFSCTDSHGSRAVIQQVAYQFLIPCIDMGTVISVASGTIEHIVGRVQFLAPGFGCFTCGGLLNPGEVRRDLMTEFERKQDPYLSGAHVPAPAVISLNGTIASLAVTMFLAVTTGVPASGRNLLYDAKSPRLRSVQVTSQATCYTCSTSGAFARGNSWPLVGRND